MKKKIISLYLKHIQRRKTAVFKFLYDTKHWIFILICSYCASDLVIISLLPMFLSAETAPRSAVSTVKMRKNNQDENYRAILDFNIFHQAPIPGSLSFLSEKQTQDRVPKLSRLPLHLNGTIVYNDPVYSVANITVKNSPSSESYQVDDTVDSLARVTKITSQRVYLMNLSNNQEEYIEVQNMGNIHFDFDGKQTKPPPSPTGGLIEQMGDFKFKVNRSDINKYIRSLPTILQEAKVVPHYEGGKMIGFRFKYIKPGSVYEQLGFKVSDIITSVAGEQPRSQLHAAELFQRFKNRSQLDMMIKRKGKDIAFSWSVYEDGATEEPPASRYY